MRNCILFQKIFIFAAQKCRVLLVGQVTTLSLSKQGFESPTRYKKDSLKAVFFYFSIKGSISFSKIDFSMIL